MPVADAVYRIDCRDSLLPGDRVRFHPGSGARWYLADDDHRDTPLIEAWSKGRGGGETREDTVTLKVTAAWGTVSPPEPGTVITHERSALAARGAFRAPWKDEAERAGREKEFDERSKEKRKELSRSDRGFSM